MASRQHPHRVRSRAGILGMRMARHAARRRGLYPARRADYKRAGDKLYAEVSAALDGAPTEGDGSQKAIAIGLTRYLDARGLIVRDSVGRPSTPCSAGSASGPMAASKPVAICTSRPTPYHRAAQADERQGAGQASQGSRRGSLAGELRAPHGGVRRGA